MDSILIKHMKETIELMLSDFVESEPDLSEDKVSMWVKDKDYYIPSTDISVTRELPPGISEGKRRCSHRPSRQETR